MDAPACFWPAEAALPDAATAAAAAAILGRMAVTAGEAGELEGSSREAEGLLSEAPARKAQTPPAAQRGATSGKKRQRLLALSEGTQSATQRMHFSE